jgi:hypothetical protein
LVTVLQQRLGDALSLLEAQLASALPTCANKPAVQYATSLFAAAVTGAPPEFLWCHFADIIERVRSEARGRVREVAEALALEVSDKALDQQLYSLKEGALTVLLKEVAVLQVQVGTSGLGFRDDP